jgi:erythromycin esterase-like protein
MLLEHYGSDTKVIVWAHNTHVGDYRATDMITSGRMNIGGLAREIYGSDKVALVGFGSYEGSVTASYMWNGPVLQYDVPEARPGSIEHACHQVVSKVGNENFYFVIDPTDHGSILNSIVGHRAIGVVYDPELEHRGNFVPTSLGNRYDAFIFFDRTNSLTPLKAHFDSKKFPETYPFGNRM